MEEVDCKLHASCYFANIQWASFPAMVREMITELEPIRFLDKTIFDMYDERFGFKCHFEKMALDLLANKNGARPHTLVVLQCPKDNQYAMARETKTGTALLSFHQGIQEACEEISNDQAASDIEYEASNNEAKSKITPTTVFCIETSSYCPRIVKLGAGKNLFIHY